MPTGVPWTIRSSVASWPTSSRQWTVENQPPSTDLPNNTQHYAPALLQVGFFAAPIEARMQTETAHEHDTAAANGIKAAMISLGISPTRTIFETRKALGWSLGDLSRRLLLPNGLTLKIERGQIGTWSLRLAERLAEALETAREDADAILRATAGSFRREAAAFLRRRRPRGGDHREASSGNARLRRGIVAREPDTRAGGVLESRPVSLWTMQR